jgi:predicted transposase YdaD
MSKLREMTESSTYKAIREEGRLEGKEEGRKEGMQEGQRKGVRELSKTCRTLVETKLGKLPPEAAVIDRITDPEKLGLLAERLIKSADAKAVREALRSFEE